MKRDSFWFFNNFPNSREIAVQTNFLMTKVSSKLLKCSVPDLAPADRVYGRHNLAATDHKTRRIKVGCSHFFHIVNGCQGSQVSALRIIEQVWGQDGWILAKFFFII